MTEDNGLEGEAPSINITFHPGRVDIDFVMPEKINAGMLKRAELPIRKRLRAVQSERIAELRRIDREAAAKEAQLERAEKDQLSTDEILALLENEDADTAEET